MTNDNDSMHATAGMGLDASERRELDPATENHKRLLAWAYSKLVYRSFDSMDDALAMDEIKLIVTGAQS